MAEQKEQQGLDRETRLSFVKTERLTPGDAQLPTKGPRRLSLVVSWQLLTDLNSSGLPG